MQVSRLSGWLGIWTACSVAVLIGSCTLMAEEFWWMDAFDSFDPEAYYVNEDTCGDVFLLGGSTGDGAYVLTDGSPGCVSHLFLNELLFVEQHLVVFFYFRGLVEGSGGPGGFTVAFVPDCDFRGTVGWGLGFHGASGIAIEFDRYGNTDFDPVPGKHVGLVRDSIRNHLAYAEDRRPWDGEWHELEVHVTLDGLTVWLDRELIIEWTDQGLLPFEGYVGFTAGTGGAQERYEIDVWVVDVDRP